MADNKVRFYNADSQAVDVGTHDNGDGTHSLKVYLGGASTTTDQSKAVAAGNIISATNAAATVTLADPGVGVSNVIGEIIFSYNGTPTAGRLTITDNATIVRDVDITTSGPGPIIFNPPLKMTAHNATTIILAAGGSGVVGKVNVTAWTE